jgi:hypothetical protein
LHIFLKRPSKFEIHYDYIEMNSLKHYLTVMRNVKNKRWYCHKIRNVCAAGNIWRLLEFPGEEIGKKKNRLLSTAYEYGHANIGHILIEEHNADVNMLFHWEFHGDRIDMIRLLLPNHRLRNIDIGFNGACVGGRIEIVRLLLSDHRLTNIDWGFRVACEGGNTEMIKLLLPDPRLTNIDWGFRVARKYGHIEMVNLIEEHLAGR